MKISIIVEDNMVVVDGVPMLINLFTLVSVDIHAIQWDNNKGEIEFKDRSIPNKAIDNFEDFQPIVSAYTAAISKRDQDVADAIANMTPEEKRCGEYPPIGNQLGALWRFAESSGLIADINAPDDTAAKILAEIQAVKNKYPKV